MAVYRIYTEKKLQFSPEAQGIKAELREILGINALEELRLLNRYDVEGVSEELFLESIPTVFSEPQLDNTYSTLPKGEYCILAVEYLPGQFDARAQSAAECIELISQQKRPVVRTARIFLLKGALSEQDIVKIKKYLINPVEAREASLEEKQTLNIVYDTPKSVKTVSGFLELDEKGLADFVNDYSLAMDKDDITLCQSYFKTENREPTITEIKMLDTYWSDHCRHTTFGTVIDKVDFEDEDSKNAYDLYLDLRKELYVGKNNPMCLMDLATIGAKYLKKHGVLKNLDESDEINACSVRITVDNDGKDEDWLLLFKNETHNHPTEIEPFGGAATCLGGAIRDPLANRGYVYQAMRVTGAANPLLPLDKTMPGKLPQRKIVTTAAAGYSSYGNQIGLATGQVDEIYHDGYVAKRMEIGAVVGAVPEANVRRDVPQAGDIVILLGGSTGRDGCGGATGSSKAHKLESLETCGAEVQKGNAPVERKIQRLFRKGEVTLMIRRCNDFGAGGVSVAIGELADGLEIDLDKIPKKYDGLDGTELAISESQERMAVVVEAKDKDAFIAAANEENLQATAVAIVTDANRLVMHWQGNKIVDISRDFINSNGADKHISVIVKNGEDACINTQGSTLCEKLTSTMSSLNVCSKKGLSERFDSTIGVGTVLMPFGGKHQLTPIQAMAAKLPVMGKTTTCSGMAWGFNPFISEKSPYRGAYLAVCESLAKLVATGFSTKNAYLTFQEYFERLGNDPTRWGKPMSALLGALKAQLDLGVAAIGGKDSMSGTFEKIDVPPTLVSFAIAAGKTDNIISPEFKLPTSRIVLLAPKYKNNLPTPQSQKEIFDTLEKLISEKRVLSAYTIGIGGLAEALCKMAFGNSIGVKLKADFDIEKLFCYMYGAFVLELASDEDIGIEIGQTTSKYVFELANESVDLNEIQLAYENRLESVMPYHTNKDSDLQVENITHTATKHTSPKIGMARPQALIPVFPGTNCEIDTLRAVERAGGKAEVFIINNLTPDAVSQSVKKLIDILNKSQMLILPGGFSGGDEPDGSAKFITSLFRNPALSEAVMALLDDRKGLALGICNGFQALVKLGLLPNGKIIKTNDTCPTLTFNAIGRHQSKLVHTRIASNKSPWLQYTNIGDTHTIAISHGEGRFVASDEVLSLLKQNGQIAAQYVDLHGNATMDIRYNPNGSALAIEAITSLDGRILGKMGHTERSGDNLYKNVDGDKYQKLFEGGVDYFK